ncbi:hypothetical protein EV659_102199 [Rhodothalassium salexigens DSM 2132]|uniref:Uncharacterized protein n=1 Tax=Rhodothalassium salexigens DSM 2132 TaxID=1188247 RepID=A0A4R2PPT4_RHOSA|nr:hypothetical protein [Rhodothalassium salexigens]MBB4210652.1 hypothetical protein [Rhodothalassium salexigens DSM 2132]TCP37792.1 hypothetical protein EV659_102199 [Rhodothalassium salexigens DSM 2132]
MAKLQGQAKKTDSIQRYKRTSIGDSKRTRPRSKNAFASRTTRRGQGKV